MTGLGLDASFRHVDIWKLEVSGMHKLIMY